MHRATTNGTGASRIALALLLLTITLALGRSPRDDAVWSLVELAAAADAFEDAAAACTGDGGALWGQSLAGPLIFADPATRRFVASDPLPAGDGRTSDATAVDAGGRRVYVGVLPASQIVANTGVDLAGRRWAMVLWPPPKEPRDRTQLLVHELWHRVQAELGFPLDTPPCDHLDEEPGRVWLRLEMRALAAALRAPDADAHRRAVADALAFRDARRAPVEGAADHERRLELSEGLAEYTGLRLSGRDDPAAWAAANLLAGERRDTLARAFPYATGPAYGLLLDAADAGWLKALTAKDDLGATLARYLNLPAPAAAAEAAAARYDGAAVRAEERQRAEARRRRRAELTAALVEGPTLALPLTRARFTFDPNRVAPLPPHGTVYANATIADAWGTLAAGESLALIAADWQRAAVSAPEPPRKSGKQTWTCRGWTLQLNDGWTLAPAPDGRSGWRVSRTED